MDVYADNRVQLAIMRELPYAFIEKKYPGVPEINLSLIENSPFIVDGVHVVPIQAYHYKLPVFGFRVGSISYITDASMIPEEEIEKLYGTKVLVINALRREKHISHFTLSEALAIIDRVKPERAFLTHIGHKMGFYNDLVKELPPHIQPAYDGLSFESDWY